MSPRDCWIYYFGTLVGMSIHPGHTTKQTGPSLEELATLADEMYLITENRKCPSSPWESQASSEPAPE